MRRPPRDPRAALQALVAWHTDFALHNKPLIVVQDRDWSSLPAEAQEQVRHLQRAYVELWVTTLREVRPDLDADRGHAMVHAAFGLLNSTPRSSYLDEAAMAGLLTGMATEALLGRRPA